MLRAWAPWIALLGGFLVLPALIWLGNALWPHGEAS